MLKTILLFQVAFNLYSTHDVLQGRLNFQRYRRALFSGRQIAELVAGFSFGEQDLRNAVIKPISMEVSFLQYIKQMVLWLRSCGRGERTPDAHDTLVQRFYSRDFTFCDMLERAEEAAGQFVRRNLDQREVSTLSGELTRRKGWTPRCGN